MPDHRIERQELHLSHNLFTGEGVKCLVAAAVAGRSQSGFGKEIRFGIEGLPMLGLLLR